MFSLSLFRINPVFARVMLLIVISLKPNHLQSSNSLMVKRSMLKVGYLVFAFLIFVCYKYDILYYPTYCFTCVAIHNESLPFNLLHLPRCLLLRRHLFLFEIMSPSYRSSIMPLWWPSYLSFPDRPSNPLGIG